MFRRNADDKRGATRYDILSTVIYVGYADYESNAAPATSAPVWTIKKTTLTSGNPVRTAWTPPGRAVWDDRATTTYE